MRPRTVFLLLAALAGCSPRPDPGYPLRSDLAGFHSAVTTTSPEAQQYFDQGLTLYYGFNHDAAISSFRACANLDSLCAMAWWGQAISAGPNINNPFMDSTAARAAHDAVSRAVALSGGASDVERALITALAERYTWPPPEERGRLDEAYAAAMRDVRMRFPDNPDVLALFADAMMNLRPWDLWTPAGEPQPGTPEIVEALERALAAVPDHPGACHFMVHTMEASPDPGRALPAADVLRTRIPGAGHLVHMPSHIDIRIGEYNNAVIANQKAILADTAWLSQPGFYAFYRAHNYHFLAYAAMFEGRRALALQAARDMVEGIPLELVRSYIDVLDGFMAVPYHVMVRFGMWEEILDEPRPPDDLLATRAVAHYARTVALASLGRVEESARELDSLKTLAASVPGTRTIGNNPVRTVLDVGLPMAEGELEYRRGRHAEAFRLLRTAVERDDALRYDEPWGWMMPVRHSLGALLLEQRELREAEEVYRADLRRHPGNGWALHGLAELLRRTGRFREADSTDGLFRAAWERSDITIRASCFCRRDGTGV